MTYVSVWKVKSKKETWSSYFSYWIMILRNSFHFWFQKPFETRILRILSRQSSTADTGWSMCLKEDSRGGNKTMFQIFKFLFCLLVISKNSSKCNFSLVFEPQWTFRGNEDPKEKKLENNSKKVRYCFAHQTIVISKMHYS